MCRATHASTYPATTMRSCIPSADSVVVTWCTEQPLVDDVASFKLVSLTVKFAHFRPLQVPHEYELRLLNFIASASI